jgi:hypothetical protein
MQRRWAVSLRKQKLEHVGDQVYQAVDDWDQAHDGLTPVPRNLEAAADDRMYRTLAWMRAQAQTSATWWIDHKDWTATDFAQAAIEEPIGPL